MQWGSRDPRPGGWTGAPEAPQGVWKVHARGGANAQAREGRRGEAAGPSRPQELLDHVAGEAVEEEAQHEQRQQRQHDLDDEPLVARADEVLDGLEGVEEPDEGGVGPAGGGERRSGRASPRVPIPSALLDPRRPCHGPERRERWRLGRSHG